MHEFLNHIPLDSNHVAMHWFLFVGVVIIVGLFLALFQRATPANPQGGSWGIGTRYFLVVLRLAIGWHILGEGIEKYRSNSWSSEAYLRESAGPLAPAFRELAGDELVARLTPGPEKSFPPVLDRQWQAYFDAFQHHYGLTEDQTAQARAAFDQERSRTRTWILSGRESVELISSYPPKVKVDKTVPDRIKDYQDRERKAQEIEQNDLPVYGSVVFAKLIEAKDQARTIRAGLQADLAKQTAQMRQALFAKLTPQQKEMPALADNVPLPMGEWGQLEWANAIVLYGLLAVGVCLLLGVLTRTACLAGGVFLLLFYLAMPPLPDWPAPPRLEGYYLYINKTFIEMLALFTLATTRSGRWFGLDALLQFLRPSSWRSAPSPDRPYAPQVVPASRPKSYSSPVHTG